MKILQFLLIFLLFLITDVNAQNGLQKIHFNTEKNLAIQGYDPVSYFTQNKAVKGNKLYVANANGVLYYFSSITNRDFFLKDYTKYEPQYGGWCAYAMGATNTKVEIDPETFKIVNGKLFLFFHSWVNNTLLKWNKDEKNLMLKADKNWSILYKHK
jgi:YHS domain-containing protein